MGEHNAKCQHSAEISDEAGGKNYLAKLGLIEPAFSSPAGKIGLETCRNLSQTKSSDYSGNAATKVSFSTAWEIVPAFSKEIISELRERMIADMRSQGLSASTQEVYLQGVKGLAAYYRRWPDQLDEKEVRRYLLYLRDERGVARGTYLPHQGGLFAHTLDRDWPLFLKKESARQSAGVCLTFCRMLKRAPSSLASGIPSQEPRCF